ncbi:MULTISPECIES: YkvI family membrane protein [unclassified Sedimentibacter]|uniref:YkvI family membrane protein n=1 Tax=unclassified Sedimentibacter TaxID=2649220 RepID=UPI0027E2047B|nr:hypothetical protein [Sedimentibacter sp. MB35-C1]WMJ77769.1 hypothetical protein RBQ61_02230 [Sedimentibacter sp. MB35-C1]
MVSNTVSMKKVISFAGSFIAFLIGSGFATGQEVMQYFSSYGFKGIAGVVVIFLLFLYVGVSFITTGYEHKFPKGSDIFEYYCGKRIGKFYDYFSIVFIYMSFFVMIAGAGATLNQQYGISNSVGGIIMAVLAAVTVVFGLGKIVDIIGKIGPVIVVMSIVLGFVAIFQNIDGLRRASEIIPKLNLMKASTNWLYAAGSYVGFCMLWLAAFMSSMGASANSKKEAAMGAVFGAAAFSAAVLIVALGLIANIEKVAGSQIPSLVIASGIHPSVAIVYSLTVVAGIYTTAVPLLWTVSVRIAQEKTVKFKTVTAILAVIGAVIGLKVPFDRLVNIVYVINGYVGIFLLIMMIFTSVKNRYQFK